MASLHTQALSTPQHTAARRRVRVVRGAAGRRGNVSASPATSRSSAEAQGWATPTKYQPKTWSLGLSDRTVGDIKKLRLVTALKTPYLESGKIDLFAYDQICQAQIDAGVEAVIVGGTTGEGHLMDWEEHIMLIAHTVNRFGDRLTVVGNTGSNSTREAAHATCQGFAVGMHAALCINPYYGKTSEAGIHEHFNAALSYGPTIVYNVPSRTCQDIPTSIVEAIAEHPNFAGVKECAGTERIKHYTDQGIVCWSGNDDMAMVDRYAGGANGVISVTSNVVPALMRRLMFDGVDDSLNESIRPLIDWLFVEPNPIGVCTMAAMTGMARPVFRLPYVPYDRAMRVEGKAIMEALGNDAFVSAEGRVAVLEDSDFILAKEW